MNNYFKRQSCICPSGKLNPENASVIPFYIHRTKKGQFAQTAIRPGASGLKRYMVYKSHPCPSNSNKAFKNDRKL